MVGESGAYSLILLTGIDEDIRSQLGGLHEEIDWGLPEQGERGKRSVMGKRRAAYERLGLEPNRLLQSGLPSFERFADLYPLVYEEGALSTSTKELVALAISIVRDCEDCITYHLIRLHDLGVRASEIYELFALTLVVGGSTVIPTLRRSVSFLAELEEEGTAKRTEPEQTG